MNTVMHYHWIFATNKREVLFFMNWVQPISVLIVATLVSGCSSLFLDADLKQVCLSESFDIQYAGNGSAMGMMMSSSMGPMGIAIGVAIDEGKEKKIKQLLVQDEQSLAAGISYSLNREQNQYRVVASNSKSCELTFSLLRITDKSDVELSIEDRDGVPKASSILDKSDFKVESLSRESLINSLNMLFKKAIR